MKQYIGTKIIQAEPASREGQEGYAVQYADGYKSWSPRQAFDESYRPCEAMTFGLAIEALKRGHRVARAGWKGMWVSFWHPMHSVDLPFLMLSYLVGSNAYPKGARVPYAPSQPDMLAEDWQIVE